MPASQGRLFASTQRASPTGTTYCNIPFYNDFDCCSPPEEECHPGGALGCYVPPPDQNNCPTGTLFCDLPGDDFDCCDPGFVCSPVGEARCVDANSLPCDAGIAPACNGTCPEGLECSDDDLYSTCSCQ